MDCGLKEQLFRCQELFAYLFQSLFLWTVDLKGRNLHHLFKIIMVSILVFMDCGLKDKTEKL